MNYVETLIAALGGARKVAEITATPVTTVREWMRAGAIPDRRKAHISQCAVQAGIGAFPAAVWLPNDIVVVEKLTKDQEQNHD